MDQAPSDTVREVGTRIVDLCGLMHGGDFQLLELIRHFDAIYPWGAAMPSCAHWLVWRCGFDMVTAREKVRVARALADLPLVREKFRSGELSYSKVRAITRVADPIPRRHGSRPVSRKLLRNWKSRCAPIASPAA